MAKLIIKAGAKVLGEYKLGKELTVVGSAKDNNIVLSDENISPRHAQIKKENDSYIIAELGGEGGFRINGQPATIRVLKNNDLIDIGNAQLVFVEEDEVRGVFPQKNSPQNDKKLSRLIIPSEAERAAA